MPDDLSNIPLYGYALCVAIFLFAGLSKGFAGFGLSAIVVAGLTLFLPATSVVPVAIVLEIVTSLGQARGIWKDIDFRALSPLLAAAVICNFIGLELLLAIDEDMARLFIAGILTAATLGLLSGIHIPITLNKIGYAIVGAVSGIANGIAAVGGLPVVLAFAATRVDPTTLRANMIAYLLGLDVVALVMAWRTGIITATPITLTGIAIPAVFLGIFLGGYGFGRADPARFRRIVLYLLLAIAVVQIIKTIAA